MFALDQYIQILEVVMEEEARGFQNVKVQRGGHEAV